MVEQIKPQGQQSACTCGSRTIHNHAKKFAKYFLRSKAGEIAEQEKIANGKHPTAERIAARQYMKRVAAYRAAALL